MGVSTSWSREGVYTPRAHGRLRGAGFLGIFPSGRAPAWPSQSRRFTKCALT